MSLKKISVYLKNNMKKLKLEIGSLYYACKHPETPMLARIVALFVVGYALSPIDLIPDFIPVLGYLDDVILLPLGIALTLKLMPEAVMVECRLKAEESYGDDRKKSWIAGTVVVCIWVSLCWFIGYRLMH